MKGVLIVDSIAIDAMGGDFGPEEVVAAIQLATREYGPLPPITLVGQQNHLEEAASKYGLQLGSAVTTRHASEVITMDEKPIQSIKQKKDASLVRAIECVKNGEAAAAISLGNTGSLMACSTLKLRTAQGIERPALGVIMPTRDHHIVLCDVGSNPEAKPNHLVHNAVLASEYCRIVLHKEAPRIGLLSIGTEENKGTETVTEAHKQLKSLGNTLNYQGPIEGFQIFENHVDVVVCNGFVGNILLKSSESLFGILKDYLKAELSRNIFRKAGALLSQQAFRDMKSQLNPDYHSGAPMLGLRGLVVKTHGSSDRKAIAGALRVTTELLNHNLNECIQERISIVNKLLNQQNNPSTPQGCEQDISQTSHRN